MPLIKSQDITKSESRYIKYTSLWVNNSNMLSSKGGYEQRWGEEYILVYSPGLLKIMKGINWQSFAISDESSTLSFCFFKFKNHTH